MGSLNNLNVLNDLNVWNTPEQKARLRGESSLLFVLFVAKSLLLFGCGSATLH
jgi:hypothetical protein